MNAQSSSLELDELENIPELPSEEQMMALVHHKRMHVVNYLCKDAQSVPGDPENIKVLLTVLKDIDSNALTRKRIKSDERSNDIQSQSAELIAKILASSNNRNAGVTISMPYSVPTLPKTISDPVLVPGEADIGATDITYETFINSFIDED